MRIALISINMYSGKLNFACPIHTYAFQQFLLRHGVETTILDYKPVTHGDFDMRHPVVYYQKRYNKFLNSGRNDERTQRKLDYLQKQCDMFTEHYHEREVRYDKFQHFINSRYVKTDKCYTSDTLEIEDPGFDCYICVTDVIWKYDPVDGFDRGYFLASKAMENKWKIAYAASRGVPPTYTPEQEAEFLYYINDINYLSVREESLKKYIESRTDRHVEMVLDPVLLNDRTLYDEVAVDPEEDHYIVLYYVMERATDTIRMAVDYARAHNLKIVELTDCPDSHRLDEYDDVEKIYRYDAGIEEWLGYIKNAECVFTNSFHGTCFSLLFEKKFYVGRRNGDKVTNLLNTVDLSWRRVSSFSEIEKIDSTPIDYDAVKSKLDEQRKNSTEFILNAISECEQHEPPRRDYDWWKKSQTYQMIYCGGSTDDVSAAGYAGEKGNTFISHGNICFSPKTRFFNNGFFCLGQSLFSSRGRRFRGWKLKITIDKQSFWYAEDGSLIADDAGSDIGSDTGVDTGSVAESASGVAGTSTTESTAESASDKAKIFAAGDSIPFIEVNHIASVMAIAVWEDGGEDVSFRFLYNSGVKADEADISVDSESIDVSRLSTGSYEYSAEGDVTNNESREFGPCHFVLPNNYQFAGWRLRVRFGETWYWYMDDGTLMPRDTMPKNARRAIKRFAENDQVPYVPLCAIDVAVAEAVWRRLDYSLLYNSGRSKLACRCVYSPEDGNVQTLPSGSVELTPSTAAVNNGTSTFLHNGFNYDGYTFAGWKLRYKSQGTWHWYADVADVHSADDATSNGPRPNSQNSDNQSVDMHATDDRKKAHVFQPGDAIPVLECNRIDVAVAQAIWKANSSPQPTKEKKGLASRIKHKVLHTEK